MILIATGKGLSEGTLRNRDPERLSNLPKIDLAQGVSSAKVEKLWQVSGGENKFH